MGKLVLAALVVLLGILCTIWFVRGRRTRVRDLSPVEQQIRELVDEVYNESVVREALEQQGDDVILRIDLRDERLNSLSINLSNLARKHTEEGLSLPAIKQGLVIRPVNHKAPPQERLRGACKRREQIW